MNGRKKKRGTGIRKRNNRCWKYIWVVLGFAGTLRAGGAVSVEGMEYGGFDVEVGGGESWEYPSGWDSIQGGGDWYFGGNVQGGNGQGENNFPSQGTGQVNPYEQSGSYGQADGQQGQILYPQEDQMWNQQWEGQMWNQQPGGQTWNQQPGGQTWNQQPGGQTWNQQPGGQTWDQQSGDRTWDQQWEGHTWNQQSGNQTWNQQPEGQMQPRQSGAEQQTQREQNFRENEKGQEAENRGRLTNTPVKATPSPVPAPSGSLLAPETEGKVKLTPSPIPEKTSEPEMADSGDAHDSLSFTYYNKKKGRAETEERIDSRILFCHDKQPKKGQLPEIHVKSQGTVQILSIHYNGRECSWYWKDDKIILEEEAGEKDNRIEILAVSEKGELAVMEPWIF